MSDAWARRKKHFLKRLERECREGRVDGDIVPLLRVLNSLSDYYTTSSCSGRIQIVSARLPGDKWHMITLAKWHRPVSVDEFLSVIRGTDHPDLWFSVQPPILHVICRTPKAALILLRLARNSGFKRAGVQGAKKQRYAVEIVGTERIEAPLRLNGIWMIREEALPMLVEVANKVLLRGKARLDRLRRALGSLAEH